MKMKLRIKVTQEHIDRAVKSTGLLTKSCPIAQAVRELIHPDISVGTSELYIGLEVVAVVDRDEAYYFTTHDADNWADLKPRTITIEEA